MFDRLLVFACWTFHGSWRGLFVVKCWPIWCADVVKVERPGSGDDTRQWGPPFVRSADGRDDGPSALLPIGEPWKARAGPRLRAAGSAVAVLADLIRRADLLVENFLPHTVEKLGLRPDQLREINPNLVSVSISGFGRTGPLAETPGYDLVIQAMAGVMSITGEPEGMPMKIGVAITDVLTGLYAAISAPAGLHARGKTGGMSFDLALADCTLASLVNVVQGRRTGQRPKRHGNAHPEYRSV